MFSSVPGSPIQRLGCWVRHCSWFTRALILVLSVCDKLPSYRIASILLLFIVVCLPSVNDAKQCSRRVAAFSLCLRPTQLLRNDTEYRSPSRIRTPRGYSIIGSGFTVNLGSDSLGKSLDLNSHLNSESDSLWIRIHCES